MARIARSLDGALEAVAAGIHDDPFAVLSLDGIEGVHLAVWPRTPRA